MSTPLWVVGAVADHDARLWLWAAAAAIDLVGSWTAHPTPGLTMQTQAHAFDASHMLERMSLLLIILLGETGLALGHVIADHHDDLTTLLMVLGGFASLVCLSAIYYGRAEQAVVSGPPPPRTPSTPSTSA